MSILASFTFSIALSTWRISSRLNLPKNAFRRRTLRCSDRIFASISMFSSKYGEISAYYLLVCLRVRVLSVSWPFLVLFFLLQIVNFLHSQISLMWVSWSEVISYQIEVPKVESDVLNESYFIKKWQGFYSFGFIRGKSEKISVATITFLAARKTIFRRPVKRAPSDKGLSQKSSLLIFWIDLASIASIRFSLSKLPMKKKSLNKWLR